MLRLMRRNSADWKMPYVRTKRTPRSGSLQPRKRTAAAELAAPSDRAEDCPARSLHTQTVLAETPSVFGAVGALQGCESTFTFPGAFGGCGPLHRVRDHRRRGGRSRTWPIRSDSRGRRKLPGFRRGLFECARTGRASARSLEAASSAAAGSFRFSRAPRHVSAVAFAPAMSSNARLALLQSPDRRNGDRSFSSSTYWAIPAPSLAR